MDRARLNFVGKTSYYIGWIAVFCAGVAHLNIARTLFTAMSLTKRNLFEVSVLCFVICIASEVRALALVEKKSLVS